MPGMDLRQSSIIAPLAIVVALGVTAALYLADHKAIHAIVLGAAAGAILFVVLRRR